MDLVGADTFWLTVTNIGLGLLCLALLGAVGWAVVADVRARRRRFPKSAAVDDHTFVVPGLGPTLADGGEPLPTPRRPREP